MILEAIHTHLYPGHKGKITGLAKIVDLKTGRDCLVAFSDGSAATARISRSGNGWQLCTNAYRTAAGTDITEKHWCVRLEKVGAHLEFHILNEARD